MPRITKTEKAALVEKRMARLRELRVVLDKGLCPLCGTKLYRNTSMTGWYQCGHLGAPGFQKEPGPHCDYQFFFDPTPQEREALASVSA